MADPNPRAVGRTQASAEVDGDLAVLRGLAIVVSVFSALGATLLLARIIDTFGAFALSLTMGLLGGAVAITAAMRLFALRGQPERQHRFRWYVAAELVVVVGVLGAALWDRQPDLFPLLVAVTLAATGLSALQVWMLWRRPVS